MKTKTLIPAVASCFMLHSAFAFEGRITVALTRNGQAAPLLYTAGTNCLRVEVTASNRPNPVDLLNLSSGEMTLLFPNNRSFVHLKAAVENNSTAPPGFPAMSAGIGPQSQSMAAPPSIGQTPAMPQMPAMPMMMEKIELTATGDKTNLLGLACEKFQIKQRGETMDIWATAQLFPFQPYLQNQPHRIGSQMTEQKWGGLLAEKKLFPLLATLKYDNGAERYRFEVKSITPEKITPDDAAKLFQPPPDYQEVRPLPY